MNETSLIRWQITYNMVILRVISYGQDKLQEYKNSTEKDKRTIFDFKDYLIYLCYIPLVMSGPLINFQDFQQKFGCKHIFKDKLYLKNCIYYLIRTVLIYWSFLVYQHVSFSSALFNKIENKNILKDLSVFDLSLLSLSNLISIWYKYICIWRIFRFWALVDGIETVENMPQCMCNNVSFSDFWKNWHASYNKWIVKYLYIPLGGNRTKIWNIFPIFLFVSIWHDVKPQMILWGLSTSIFMLPELIISKLNKKQKQTQIIQKCPKQQQTFYTLKDILNTKFFIKTFMSSLLIVLLVLSNLIGFSLGHQGLKEILLDKIFNPLSFLYLIIDIIFLLPIAFFMHSYRIK